MLLTVQSCSDFFSPPLQLSSDGESTKCALADETMEYWEQVTLGVFLSTIALAVLYVLLDRYAQWITFEFDRLFCEVVPR